MAKGSIIKKCEFCGAEMDGKVKFCPCCGKKNEDNKPFYKKKWFIIFAGILCFLIVVGAIGDLSNSSGDTPQNKDLTHAEEKSNESEAHNAEDNDAETDFACEDLSKKIDQSDSEAGKADFVMTADELSQEYYDNPFAAEEKYKGKTVRITGKIFDIYNDMLDSDKTFSIYGRKKNIQCHFKKRHLDELMLVKKGDKVTIQGKVGEQKSNINIEKTRVLKIDRGKDGGTNYAMQFGERLLTIESGEYADTQYYAQMSNLDIDVTANIVSVALTTIPRGEFEAKLRHDYGEDVDHLDRSIIIDFKEKQYKCTDYTAMRAQGVIAPEDCEGKWHPIKKRMVIYYILEALQPVIDSSIGE